MLLSGEYNRSAGAPSPRFPVRLGGVNKLNAALLIESRTSNHGWCRAVGNSGSLPVLFRQGWDATTLNAHCRVSHPSQKPRRMGHPLFAALPTCPPTTLSLHLNSREKSRLKSCPDTKQSFRQAVHPATSKSPPPSTGALEFRPTYPLQHRFDDHMDHSQHQGANEGRAEAGNLQSWSDLGRQHEHERIDHQKE
jgi:hypothetical protein